MATKLLATAPKMEASLLLCVVASDHTLSGVLIHEKEEGTKVIQRPIYFVSEALSGAKLNYSKIEKKSHT
jgi:hypothetical protein